MPFAEGTITAVHARTQQRKSDNKTFTVYEVILDGDDRRKYQTFNRSIANEANRFLNQRVELGFHAEQRGAFENLYLDDVQPPQDRSYAPAREQLQADEEHRVPLPIPEAPAPSQRPTGTFPDAKDWSIWRQTAAKVSAHLSHTPAEFWSNIDDLVDYFHNGKKPDRFLHFIPPMVRDRDMSQDQPQESRYVPAGAYDEPIPTPDDSDIPF